MRMHGSWRSDWRRPWEDRVAGPHEPLDDAGLDVHRAVREAVDAAETAAECALAPLAELVAAMPLVVEIEWRRGRRRWRAARRR